MFKIVAGLALAAAVLFVGLRADTKSTEAQVPCIPTAPFSTTCAPVNTLRILCPNNLLPYNQTLLYGSNYFVNYYGNTLPIYNGYYWGYNSPVLVAIDNTTGQITQVTQIPDSRFCERTLAPTPVPTPVVVERVVERQVIVQQPAPAAPAPVKAGIAPPRTGDAGLK